MVGCNILFDMTNNELGKKKVTAQEKTVTNNTIKKKIKYVSKNVITYNVMKYNAQNAQRTPQNV